MTDGDAAVVAVVACCCCCWLGGLSIVLVSGCSIDNCEPDESNLHGFAQRQHGRQQLLWHTETARAVGDLQRSWRRRYLHITCDNDPAFPNLVRPIASARALTVSAYVSPAR